MWIKLVVFLCCISSTAIAQDQRIITLNSSLTETVFGLGLGNKIVATDVTSISPLAAQGLPKVSNSRSVSVEGLLSFNPTLILASKGDVSQAIIQQLKKVKVNIIIINQSYSIQGAEHFIKEVGEAVGAKQAGQQLAKATSLALYNVVNKISSNTKTVDKPKVLFIYARGAGTMSVAGKSSMIDELIKLAGGINAIQEFSDFKTYSSEGLVKANPDVILMFDFGFSSLGGIESIVRLPGMNLTNAGKNKRIVAMNASLLVNFSSRLPDAIAELNKQLYNN